MAWGVCGMAMAAGACTGFLVRRWAGTYAAWLESGAAATAGTLWAAAAAAAGRPVCWAPDGALALLLGGLAVGLVWSGTPGLVPLALGLAVLAGLDARSGLLPDALTLPLMVAGWGLGLQPAGAAVGASLATWAALAGLAWLYRRLRGHDGFGGGDVKCLAALAGWLGLDAAAGILWLACVLGVGLCLGRRDGWRRPYPFGPCMALAAWVWLLLPRGTWLAVQSWF